MLQGFKDFIARGNAVEMAVGIVIGAAFGSVIEAITEQVLNPLIGAIFGQPNLDRLIVISTKGGEILPGAVVTAFINFLLVAAAIYFLVVVPMNKLAERRAQGEEEEEEPVAEDVALLAEIRDLLAKNSAN